MRLRVLLVGAVLLSAGCGSAELTPEERVVIAEAHVHFTQLVLDGSDYGPALDSVDRIVALYREKPDAEYDDRPMREVLLDAASDLDRYRPDMAAELDRAVAE